MSLRRLVPVVLSFVAVPALAGVWRPPARPPVPVHDVAPLEPLERCEAAGALELLVQGVERDAQGVRAEPGVTRAFRHLAHCDRSGPVDPDDASAVALLAEASLAEAVRLSAPERATAALETWGAALHQGHDGTLVSAALAYDVEADALEALLAVAPRLAAADRVRVAGAAERLHGLQPAPTAASDIAATDLLWVSDALDAPWCRRALVRAAPALDAAASARDPAGIAAAGAAAVEGWRGWVPGSRCVPVLAFTLTKLLERAAVVDRDYGRLQEALHAP
ncbi:MAG: hypothetical protein R3F59_27090 [Myxococcota bacterium]